ncbi:hypothetical protein QFZ98_006558 [Paraburkholderia youngii]
MDRLAAQVVELREGWRLRTGHDHFAYCCAVTRRHEVDLLQAGLRDRQIARGDVAPARYQPWEQLVARRRNDDQRERTFAERRLVFPVQIALEVPHQAGGQPSLVALLIHIERSTVGNQYTDQPPVQHGVEIAGERLIAEIDLARGGS